MKLADMFNCSILFFCWTPISSNTTSYMPLVKINELHEKRLRLMSLYYITKVLHFDKTILIGLRKALPINIDKQVASDIVSFILDDKET